MNRVAILAFGFGSATTISGQRIAAIATRRARLLQAPIYTQIDVPIRPDVGVDVTSVLNYEGSGKPPPTLPIARSAVLWAKGEGIEKLYIIAATPHLWRVLRDTRQAIREIDSEIEILVCEEIHRYPNHSWFSPNSRNEQMRIRSRLVWWLRETVLKLMPFWLYEKVAG